MAQARRINSVKKLNGSTGCGWLINVKLCKLWDRHHFKNWDRVESREMLLMDSNGDRIVAGVHRDHFHRFNEKLIEATSLLISNFGCAKKGERFKQCKHVFRIKFDERTTIEPGPYVDTTNFGGIHGFDFVSFAYINATKDLSKLVGTIDDVITWHKITIEELSTITIPRSNYALIATIEALDPDFGWYYISCRKCHKSVKEEAVPIVVVKIEGETSSKKSRSQIPSKTVFRCETEGCPKPITTASPRYKMRLDVEDGTPGSCTFVMFDDCIRHLMNKSCEQIRETIPPGTPNNQILEELYQLVGKRLIFKFEATDYVIQTGSTVYKCTKIIEDPILIKKFENVVCPVEIEDDNSITNLDTSNVAISRSVSSNIPKVTGSSSIGTEYDQDDEPITPVSSIQKWKVVEIDVDDQEHQALTNKKHV
ncbi:OLC1v1009149C1 [Oldenlandia corymbosa var. corymbosa]|uniref:OLC1v1009149C1 n=1 Tax=Oldenlandia corymbosa var. corymbosa TaxID=529605 RepID=A0AAV1DQP0_OLDCO|nr:OLC1v1009149C1 [Oldenlandia corymbosa var. corymbosa]